VANYNVRQSVLSSETIPYPVTFEKNGTAQDPTAYTVKFAFPTSAPDGTQPATGDWIAGTWETDTVPVLATPYVAVTPVIGANGTVLAEGTYYPWIQVIVSGTVIHVEPLGTLTVY
jgi:hypothetical protein